MAWTAPRTWGSERVTANLWNNHWKANIAWLARVGVDGWVDWTPEWTSTGTAPAISNGTLTGRYAMVARTVFAEARLTCGGSTTYGTGSYSFTLPVTAAAAYASGGGGIIEDVSPAADYTCHVDMTTTTTFQLYTGGTTLTVAGQTSPITWASGDGFRIWFTYQAAS